MSAESAVHGPGDLVELGQAVTADVGMGCGFVHLAGAGVDIGQLLAEVAHGVLLASHFLLVPRVLLH